jgi:salicylate hydroxylase
MKQLLQLPTDDQGRNRGTFLGEHFFLRRSKFLFLVPSRRSKPSPSVSREPLNCRADSNLWLSSIQSSTTGRVNSTSPPHQLDASIKKFHTMGTIPKEEPLPKKPINLAVIGGGLAGLALTIGLLPHAHNIKTTVYESAPAFAEIGVGVAFGPNVVRAMGMISPAILKGFKKHVTGNSPTYPELANVWASFRYGMDSKTAGGSGRKYGDLICHLEGTEGGLGEMLEKEGIHTRSCIHRARFLEELVKLVPEGTAIFGKRLVEIEELEEGGVRLKFADGEKVTADAVIGCDGIKSMTRQMVFGEEGKHATPQFTGEYAYRALVPEAIARETLGDELAMNCQLYIGYRNYIMSYPVEHGKFVNIAAVRQKGDLEWDDKNWIIPSTKEDMMKDFEGWGSNIIDLISRFETKDKWGSMICRMNRSIIEGGCVSWVIVPMRVHRI